MRVLVLARSYPNPEMPLLGLWTQRLTESVMGGAEIVVIAPVPYAPPLPASARFEDFNRFRRIASRRDGAVPVLHPRFVVGPGASTAALDAVAYAVSAGRVAARLRRDFRFDLIHAHFGYPDGVAACLIGAHHRVPVVITEHAPWVPWMNDAPWIARQARWAAQSCAVQIPVSRYVRRTIIQACGGPAAAPALAADPIGMPVDGELFQLSRETRRPGMLLFVGAIRHIKGLDVLVEALSRVVDRCPAAHLVVAGEAFYRSYERDAQAVGELARRLGVDRRISFLGRQSPAEVARLMAQSQTLVVPSRAESFSSVTVEALACGTPVVATRSGGPEDILTDEVGRLVPVEDVGALAEALTDVLEQPGRFSRPALRAHALERYRREVIGERILCHYTSAIAR